MTQEEPPRSRVIPAKVAAPALTVARYSEGNRRLQERDVANYDKLYTAVSLLPENDDALDEAARLIIEGAASLLSLSPLRLSFCCLQARLNEHPRAGPPASPARWSLLQRGDRYRNLLESLGRAQQAQHHRAKPR